MAAILPLSVSSERYEEDLEYFFKDPAVVVQITTIRQKFKLPLQGIKSHTTPDENDLFASLMVEESALKMTVKSDDPHAKALSKPIRLKNKNRCKEFDEAITGLLKDLPERFRWLLKYYVIYGECNLKNPVTPHHQSRCSIRIDNGKVFIEIDGDTQESDLKLALNIIRKTPQYNAVLKGKQLHRQSAYFLGKLISEGREPVDPTTGKSLID